MPVTNRRTLTGILLKDGHELVLQLADNGYCYLDAPAKAYNSVGSRVIVEGIRSGFNRLNVSAITLQMKQVLFRQRAISDLEEIWKLNIDQGGTVQANGYLRGLEASVNFFAEHPEEACRINGIQESIISWDSGPSTFYAECLEDQLVVTRILHDTFESKSR